MTWAALLDHAAGRRITITTAESCTGGMVSAAITDIAGSSRVFDRGYVTYSNAAKTQMLGVRPETLDQFGAVSEQTAAEMAEGALRAATATVAISVTGIAGPGGSEHKPEGRVCFGIAVEGKTATETVDFGPLGRTAVREATCAHALTMLRRATGMDQP